MSDERSNKAIFSGDGKGPPTQEAIKAGIRESMGLDVPTELVPLPSAGKVYPEGSPLHDKAALEITPMTAREEDILTSRALIKKGTVITALLKSCIADQNVDVSQMISGDRNAIMTAIRITGYGPEYQGEVECTEVDCQHKFEHTFMLNQLPIKPLTVEPVALGTNEFAFDLPVSKKRVTFRFMTGRDEEEMIVTQDKLKKLGSKQDNLVTSRLLYSLVSVAGDTDRNKISQFIRRMPARDSLVLRNYMDSIEPGIEMRQSVTCPVCEHEEVVSMSLGTAFFWPGTRA